MSKPKSPTHFVIDTEDATVEEFTSRTAMEKHVQNLAKVYDSSSLEDYITVVEGRKLKINIGVTVEP